jgi:hypothetical protein
MSAPHWYSEALAFQVSAEHAPETRRVSNMPRGQGACAQQTPHPLQADPSAGFGGAMACRKITFSVWRRGIE